MCTVTARDLRILSAETCNVTLEVTGWDRPIKLVVTPYENGVVVQIPWHHRDRLGAPSYEGLKWVLRRHYTGSIGTRTETDPRFRRAAAAREGTALMLPANRVSSKLQTH